MKEQKKKVKYYVLILSSGLDLRCHDFEKAPDGTYLFAREEAKESLSLPYLEDFIPVAVPVKNLEKIIRNRNLKIDK